MGRGFHYVAGRYVFLCLSVSGSRAFESERDCSVPPPHEIRDATESMIREMDDIDFRGGRSKRLPALLSERQVSRVTIEPLSQSIPRQSLSGGRTLPVTALSQESNTSLSVALGGFFSLLASMFSPLAADPAARGFQRCHPISLARTGFSDRPSNATARLLDARPIQLA